MKRFSIFLFFLVVANVVFASTGDTGMPYEPGMKKFVDSLTGPTAFYVSTAAAFAAIATLIFGGEMSQWVKTTLILIISVCSLLSINNLIKNFSGTGAVLTEVSATYQPKEKKYGL